MRAEHHGNIEFRNDKRRLSVREAGLIQTFSPTFKFTEKSMSLPYKFIGNAVPPLLSYLIADKVNFLLTNHF
jgi:DNA (cytosine-5)-methyltransferase 1